MTDEKVRVVVATGEFRYDREHYTEGDELEVQEQTLKKHPRTLQRVEEADESDGDEPAGFDADEWLEKDFETRASAVRDGEVDDHLEEIKKVETSGTVEEAVEERQAELEG